MGNDDLDAAVRKIEQEAANREREAALRKSQEAHAYERRVRANQCHLDRLEDAAEDFVPQAADARVQPRETTITRVTITKTVWGRRREKRTEIPVAYWALQESDHYSRRVGYYLTTDAEMVTGDSFGVAKALDPADATEELVDLLIKLMAQVLVNARSGR